MLLREPPAWNRDSAALLKQFYESGTGQLFLAHLASSRPPLLVGGELNSTALRASEAAGYERCVNIALSLSEPPREDGPDAETETYPHLDDDSKWPKNTP